MPNASNKTLDKEEAKKDISAFSILEGPDGDRVIEHLCIKFKAFDTQRSKDAFEAGYDEGVRAVLVYIASTRSQYQDIIRKLEEK